MRIPPPSVIASWPAPNYSNPVTRGPAVAVTNTIFLILVTVAVMGRFYSRIYVKRWFGVDDWLAVPAYICTICMTIVVILAVEKYGCNMHVWDLPHNKIQSVYIISMIAKVNFTLATTFIRLSFTSFYYRLIKDTGNRRYKWILHASIAFIVAVGFTFFGLILGTCWPIEAYWTYPPMANARCLNDGIVMFCAGIIHCVADLITVLVPLPIIMRLKLPLRQRIEVTVLLSAGLVVTLAGAVRAYYTWKSLIKSWDGTWYAYSLWLAASVEIDLGMLCLCAPAWRPLLQGPVKRLSSMTSTKLSFVRSSGNEYGLSAELKGGKSMPLRSLHQFQRTRLAFERTVQDPNDDDQPGIKRRDFVPLREPVGIHQGEKDKSQISTRSATQWSKDRSSARSSSVPSVPSSWIPPSTSNEREFV